ncbi:MAG: SIR2 family protein [Carboxylicivirga sp.]|jgi:NAD-dependent SIR2 family protein deacetylase|nr:SIR2 family protein [Carboxylicivirga sp.]
MQNKIVKNNEHVISRVEDVLTTALNSNEEFNNDFDGEQLIQIDSKIPERGSYSFAPSEILFWVERVSYWDELENYKNEEIESNHKELISFLFESNQDTVFEGLIDSIKRQRITPFVGAGISKSYSYPLWGEALDSIYEELKDMGIDEYNQLIKTSSYLEAAQALFDKDPQQFNYFIKKRFEITEATKKEICKPGIPQLLTKITNGAVITTNYDKILEVVFEAENKPFQGFMHGVQQKNQFVSKLIKGDRCILKLHGDVEYEDTYIFCKQQYDDAYNIDERTIDFKKPLPKTLRQIFISNSLLFLGCSLEQDRTLELFKFIKEEGQFEIPEHFALLENKNPDNRAWKRETENRLLPINIRPIWYPKGKFNMPTEMLGLALDVVNGKVEFKKPQK